MPNLNILIIEDSESEAGLLVRELRRSGYEVTSRRIETEADMLTALQTAAWDVILSDYSMPHFSGLAALRLIKEQRLDIPLIFVSGTIGEDAAVMAMKEGAVDYLLKDRLARLGAAVAHALETRQLREKRKLAEEQLRLQQSALESAANAIVITNTRGELLWANPAFHTMTCYAPAEVAGQCLRFLKSGRHDEAFYRDLWETILAGRVWEGEIINRRKDGTLYPERMTITPVRAADAGITHFIAVKQDVTERKKLEGEVEFRERQISSFFSGAAAGLAILDANLCFVQINGALAEINGVPADEHIGKTVSEIVPHLAPEVVPLFEHVLATGDPILNFELTGETPREPGVQRHWIESFFPIAGKDGKPQGVGAIVVEITKQKRAEAALRDSEERYRKLVELSPDAIYIHCQGKFVLLNKVACDLFGAKDPAELIGTSILDRVHPDFHPVVRDRIRTIQDEGVNVPPLEEKLVRIDGTTFDAEVAAAPFPYRGKPSSLVIVRDITEKKALNEKMLRNQRLESIGTLAGGIAHDLNNVLAPILMSLEILGLKFTDEPSRKLLSTIASSAQRGAELVKQVLAFSRGMQGERVAVQLRHVVREMKGIIRETFPKSITLEVQMPSELWTVTGDSTQLHQVLMNLCVNARDAMPHGGKLSIRGENLILDDAFARMNPETKPGPHVLLTIADTGVGMSPEVQRRIFEPFFTTKEPGKGTGLGLSTVRGIVKSHGGFLEVETKAGRGTKFKVYLRADGSTETERAKAARLPWPTGRGELILVVDDERAIQEIAHQVLQMSGYRVLTAGNGADAVALCAQHADEVKLVITDLMMPIMDGPATIRAVRIMAPHVKVIAASGLASATRTTDPKKLGVDAFLRKPFTAEMLLRTVGETLAG